MDAKRIGSHRGGSVGERGRAVAADGCPTGSDSRILLSTQRSSMHLCVLRLTVEVQSSASASRAAASVTKSRSSLAMLPSESIRYTLE
jgi:hypothetical protein